MLKLAPGRAPACRMVESCQAGATKPSHREGEAPAEPRVPSSLGARAGCGLVNRRCSHGSVWPHRRLPPSAHCGYIAATSPISVARCSTAGATTVPRTHSSRVDTYRPPNPAPQLTRMQLWYQPAPHRTDRVCRRNEDRISSRVVAEHASPLGKLSAEDGAEWDHGCSQAVRPSQGGYAKPQDDGRNRVNDRRRQRQCRYSSHIARQTTAWRPKWL
jgi:hypothetical protein